MVFFLAAGLTHHFFCLSASFLFFLGLFFHVPSSRFIINVPDEELASVERICFQIEQAHWFYEDFIREQNPALPSFNLKSFSAKFFQHCPLLHEWANEHETAFANFMEYKIRVPVCGAIILNDAMDKVNYTWVRQGNWLPPNCLCFDHQTR